MKIINPYNFGTSCKAWEFDGVDEYITFGNVLSFDRTDAFSVSMQIKPNTSGSGTFRQVLTKNLNSTTFRGWGIYIDNSEKINFVLNNLGTNRMHVKSVASISLDVWSKIEFIYDGSAIAANMIFKINDSTSTLATVVDALTATTISTAPLCIGARNAVDGFFDGAITDVIIKNNLSVIVGYWNGQNSTNVINGVIDQSASGFDGTMTNMEDSDIINDCPI